MLTHTYVTSTSCWIILEKLLPCFSLPCLQGAADQGKIASIAHGSSMLSVASDRYYMHRILVLRPDKKKLTMASPHLVYKILQTVYSHNPTQCLQVILSKCAVSILHVCCLFMFVLSWVTIYIYLCMCVICGHMGLYGSIWLNFGAAMAVPARD